MEVLTTKPRGLQRYPNQLSVERGALVLAKNAVQDRDDIVEVRRGLKHYGTSLTFASDKKPNTFYEFSDRLLLSYDNKIALDSDDAGTWSNYSGTFSPALGASVCRSVQANKNLYITTDTGIKKLETTAAAFASAGMPKALDGVASTTGGSGWMSDSTQAAYRVVWGIKDSNLNLILGSPSQRIIVVNSSGGTRNVSLTFSIPSGITTSHFFQVYRSVMSTGVSVDPNDELGLVYEANPTSGEISALSITFTDIAPEGLRGATLYTSPSQQGIGQANERPPLCRDMVAFKNHIFFLNTVSRHRFIVTLVSVGGTGLVANDTITIGSTTYTGKASENAAAAEFLVSTGGTAADNIETTAISLVRVINQYTSNTSYYAYYVSGYNDLPGQILIEERGIGGASFALISTRGNAFSPTLPTSGTAQSSTNFTSPNGVGIAKQLQPEAVPIGNILLAGSADKKILRGVALRDSIFLLKEDGIYRIVGDTVANFTVSLFDETVILKGDETAVSFNNQVFFFSNQGIVAVSETGVDVISRPIEADLFELSALDNFLDNTFGIAYESDRKYILFTIADEDDTFATQAYVFNVFTNSLTGPWPMNRSCGIVKKADDKLYLGSWDQNSRYIYQERKSFTNGDYADEEFPLTIVSSSTTTITVSDTTGLVEGDKITQGARFGIIGSVTDSTHVVVDRTENWAAGSATAYRPIDVELTFVPDTANNPGILKQFTEATLFFERANFRALSIGFSSNFSPGIEEIETPTPPPEGPWGSFPWGSVPWGGGSPSVQPIRTYVPLRKQRCSWLNLHIQHNEALGHFAFSGYSLQFDPMSERMF